MHGRLAAAAALALCAGLEGAAAQSLKEAVQLAIANDSSVTAAAAGARSARLESEAASRSLLPVLTAGANYQYTSATAEATLSIPNPITHTTMSQTITLGQQNVFDGSAGARWTIFSGFALEAAAEMKKLESTLALFDLDSTKVDVALKTVAAYRGAQASMLQIDILTSARDRTQLLIDQTTALEHEGMARRIDILSLESARLDYEQKLIVGRASLADSLDQLEAITGRPISVAPPPSGEPSGDPKKLDMDEVVRIKAVSVQRSLLEQGKRLAEAKLYPTVSVAGAIHYGIPGVNPVKDEWMLYGIAGASLSWSFNWGGDVLSVEAAQSAIEKLGNDESSARSEVKLEYASALRDWQAAKEALGVLSAALDLARTKMGIVKSQHEQGMATSTEYNDANLGLTMAELQYSNQLLALSLKTTQIDALSGAPIDTWSLTE